MIIPNNEQMAIFESYRTKNNELILGRFEGAWEYREINGDFHCFNVRYGHLTESHKKEFRPFIYKNNKLISTYPYKTRPIYNVNSLIRYPDKLVLLVEGEKTADKVQEFFPEYNVITWMGGTSQAKNADITHLKDKKICLWPDKDESGYKAMEVLKERLRWVASEIGMTNPRSLKINKPSKIGIPGLDVNNCGWDLADLDIEHGEYDFDYIKLMIDESFIEKKQPFDVKSYPQLTESTNPRPLDTTLNFKHLLDFYNIQLKWNIMKRECEATVPGIQFYYEEKDNEVLTYLENLAITHSFKIGRVGQHMDAIALANRYHPVRDWILSKPSTNHEILDIFIKIIKTTDDDLAYLLIKRWMISAIAALFNEGDFVAQGVLVLQGTTGWRKTSFISMLAPQEFKAIKKGSELDPANKDNLIRLAKYWMAELGELGGTINKSESNKLKAHITNELDEARRPYAAKDSQLIRRTIYAGTVNEENFLVDETGNRRWWVISLRECIDTDRIKELDLQQVWRAAYELYLKGERAYLDEDELNRLNKSNEKYEKIDPLAEKLDIFFDWEIPERIEMSATEVLFNIGYDKPDRSLATKMSILLRKRKVPTKKRSVYLMPKMNFNCSKIM